MTDTTTLEQTARNVREDVSPKERTLVIVLAQVATIVALLVAWSIIRSKRAAAKAEG